MTVRVKNINTESVFTSNKRKRLLPNIEKRAESINKQLIREDNKIISKYKKTIFNLTDE